MSRTALTVVLVLSVAAACAANDQPSSNVDGVFAGSTSLRSSTTQVSGSSTGRPAVTAPKTSGTAGGGAADTTTAAEPDTHPTRSAAGEGDAQPDPSDYLWVDLTALRTGRTWMEVLADGRATFVRFGVPGTGDLAEVRTGVLDRASIDELFAHLVESRILDDGHQAAGKRGDVVEGGSLILSAQFGQQSGTLTFGPADAVTPTVSNLVKAVEHAVEPLDDRSPPTRFVRASDVSPDRLARLEQSEQEFVPVTNETLTEDLPGIYIAITSLGRLVPLEPGELSIVEDILSTNSSIFVITPAGALQLEIYTLPAN